VNAYVEAGYSVVLATLALYAGRLVLRRRTLERWLPEQGERRSDAVPVDSSNSAPPNEPRGPDGPREPDRMVGG
jgi:hypothetical protein